MKQALTAFLGLAMGFGLSRMGFSDFGEVHRMFTFRDFRLLLTFAGAVALTMAGTRLLTRRRGGRRNLHVGTIAGGVLFGIGWALTGACPSIAWVQLGEGKVLAALTLVGMLAGAWLYPAVHRRCFRWDSESC